MNLAMARQASAPFVLLSLLAAVTPAIAASFDCARASRPDERAICAHPKLSDMDVEMATLYRVRLQMPMLMGSRGAAGDEQLAWLAKRRACGGDVGCLTSAYRSRIDQLGNIIADGMKDYCIKLGICG
jgi:uncharacterized protein